MQAAWREVGVILCALLHRAIEKSDTRCVVRLYTCVNSVKLLISVCAFMEVYSEGSQDRTHGKFFRNILCRPGGFWDLECSEFDSTSFKKIALFCEKFTHVPFYGAYILKYFISRCWILKFQQIMRKIYNWFRAAGSWNFNEQHAEHIWWKRGSEDRYFRGGTRTPWSSRMRFYRGLGRRIARLDAR